MSGICAHLNGRKLAPDIRPALAAGRADEAVRDVGQPDVIGPLVCGHRDRMAAPVIGAIDQHVAADAHLAHFAEGDVWGAMPLLKRRPGWEANEQETFYKTFYMPQSKELLLLISFVN